MSLTSASHARVAAQLRTATIVPELRSKKLVLYSASSVALFMISGLTATSQLPFTVPPHAPSAARHAPNSLAVVQSTAQPRAGSALLWPATYNDRPFESDPRTMHEALPPTKGTKFAANFWLHQYDYVKAHVAGCTA